MYKYNSLKKPYKSVWQCVSTFETILKGKTNGHINNKIMGGVNY